MYYHNVGTSLELHGPTKDTINPAYHTITDDRSKKSVGEPISYYEEVKIPPEEVKMTSNPALCCPLNCIHIYCMVTKSRIIFHITL